MPIPLLLLSDAPTAGTGLGRITRDLAVRIHCHLSDIFEIATAGYGGPYSRKLPFHQYEVQMKDWVVYNLPDIWKDFAGDRKGIVMTIWDASRLLWLARPENCNDPQLRKFLTNRPFELHGYFPMDATGPNDKLTAILAHTIDAYDRVLAYSKWAEDILKRTLDPKELDLDWRPHGIDTSVFYPRHYRAARNGFGQRINAKTQKGKWMVIPTDACMVGIIATNQARKDFGLGIQAVAELRKTRTVYLWIHTDILERYWSLPALIHDYGFDYDKVVITENMPFSDEQMAWCYSACDMTLGIGAGEGFGYPIFESLACGVPCVHGNYGGAAEHLPDNMLVPSNGSPVDLTMRLEGCYNCFRPVHHYGDWVFKMEALPKRGMDSLLPAHLDWNNLWPSWAEWLTEGARNVR